MFSMHWPSSDQLDSSQNHERDSVFWNLVFT